MSTDDPIRKAETGSLSNPRTAVIISVTSDIGSALCRRWLGRGWTTVGTYRRLSPEVELLRRGGLTLSQCDLSDPSSVRRSCEELCSLCPAWDALMLCPGTQSPIGPFVECPFEEWAESIEVNFTSQMRLLRALLPYRRKGTSRHPSVILFAGGGTNSAPTNYSAYTVAKIALIKMCELLAAEIPDTRFAILGPGWVNTKIHKETIAAGTRAEANYERTTQKLASDEMTPMDTVLDCCEWLLDAPPEEVSGRNFSVVFDKWGSEDLAKMLRRDPSMYKLRRFGNDLLVKNA